MLSKKATKVHKPTARQAVVTLTYVASAMLIIALTGCSDQTAPTSGESKDLGIAPLQSPVPSATATSSLDNRPFTPRSETPTSHSPATPEGLPTRPPTVPPLSTSTPLPTPEDTPTAPTPSYTDNLEPEAKPTLPPSLPTTVPDSKEGTPITSASHAMDDHGDNISSSTDISVGKTVSGEMEDIEDTDFFRFPALDAKYHRIDIKADAELYLSAAVYEPDGDRDYAMMHFSQDGYRLVWEAPSSSDFYVGVSTNHGTGAYTLTITVADNPDDHQDTVEGATPLEVGIAARGVLDFSGDLDYFSFPAEAGRKYDMAASPGDPQLFFRALPHDKDGKQLELTTHHVEGGRPRRLFVPETTGEYYVRVSGDGTTGPYSLIVITADLADDHADNPAEATALAVGEPRRGSLDHEGDSDYFRFKAILGEMYKVELNHERDGYPSMVLLDSSGLQVKRSRHGQYRRPWEIYWKPDTSGEHYIQVEQQYAALGPYTLTVTPGVIDDHGNNQRDASQLGIGEPTLGKVDYLLDLDAFRFIAKEGQLYWIGVTPGTLSNFRIRLFEENGSREFWWIASYQEQGYYWAAPRTGEFFALVDGFDGRWGQTGTYTLAISLTPLNVMREEDKVGAAEATHNQPYPGTAGPSDNIQYFRFDAEKGQIYWIDVEPGTLPSSVTVLYDTDGRRRRHTSVPADHAFPSRIVWESPQTERLYVAVSPARIGDAGSFTLTVTEVADEHGEDPGSATGVPLHETLPGALQTGDDTDYFQLQATGGQRYKITLESDSLPNPSFDSYIRIYDKNGHRMEYSKIAGTSQLIWIAPEQGRYYIVVANPFGESTGPYTLTVSPFDIPKTPDD